MRFYASLNTYNLQISLSLTVSSGAEVEPEEYIVQLHQV